MKTIRSKLLTTVIIIICISFFATALSAYFAIGSVYKKREGAALSDAAKRLSLIASGIMGKTDIRGYEYTNILESIYDDDIEAYSKSTGYYIITADKYKRVIFSSNNVNPFINKKGIPLNIINAVVSGKSLNGENVLSDYYGVNVITSAFPVYSGNKIIGAVVCSLPTDYLSALRTQAMKSLLLVIIPVLILSLIMVYYFSLKITNPITKISKASKLIASGDLSARVDVISDDEIGELTHTFNEMADALENADDIKNSFISDVSHELRTPMTSIIGFLEAIIDGTIDKNEQRKYIEICLNESKRLSRLVTRLLEVARLESDENKIYPEIFDINEKIRNIIFKYSEEINNKNIKLSASFPEENTFVYADFDAIERVVTNLIDNAVKFTQIGGNIFIDVKKSDKKAFITVKNTGYGINDDDIKHIWDRFYKTDKSRSIDKKGAGLGLYITKKIITAHGENINVYCEKDQSSDNIFTIFTFSLKMTEKEIL